MGRLICTRHRWDWAGQLTVMVDVHVSRLSMLEVAGCTPPKSELGISPIPTGTSLLVEV